MNTVIHINDLSNECVVRRVAKQYLQSMVEVQQDMFLDLPADEQESFAQRLDTATIRDMAASYADDMLAEFQDAVVAEIKRYTFETKFQVDRKLKAVVNFSD